MKTQTDVCASNWRKSTHSGGGNQCVEVGILTTGDVAVRDTRDRDAGMHRFSASAWSRFLSEIMKLRVSGPPGVASPGSGNPVVTNSPSLSSTKTQVLATRQEIRACDCNS